MSSKRRSPNAVKEETIDSFSSPPADLLAPPVTNLVDEYLRRPPERFTAPAVLVSIELPIGEFREQQNRPMHVEARLSPKQGRALQRLLNGLNAKHGRGWGPRDCSNADVLRWLLDQLPD